MGSPRARPAGAALEDASFSADGSQIVTASLDGTARVWDTRSGRQLTLIREPVGNPVEQASFSPDGELIATAETGGIGLWNAQTHAMIRFVQTSIGLVRIAFNPSGERIVAASEDGTACLFSASLSSIGVISEPGGASITSAVFSPDGRSVLTSSQAGTVRVWNATTDAPNSVITEPGNASVASATFSPDGKLIGTASLDGTARIWDRATGQQLTEFDPGGALSDIAFSPDGRSAITSGAAATIWSTELASPLATIEQLARQRVPAGFSAAEIASYLQGIGP